jgi:hypothetical protein
MSYTAAGPSRCVHQLLFPVFYTSFFRCGLGGLLYLDLKLEFDDASQQAALALSTTLVSPKFSKKINYCSNRAELQEKLGAQLDLPNFVV